MVTATIATRPDRDTERALFIEFGHGRVDFPGISLEELAGGERDLVLLALPVVDAEIETIRMFEDRFLLAVPAEDPLPATARVNATQVDQRRLILLEEGHCLRDQALSYCAGAPHVADRARRH